MWKVYYTKQSLKDKKNLVAAKLDTKAKKLIELIEKDPYQTPPPFERLTGNLSGIYSRRINLQHRLTYQILDASDGSCKCKGCIKILRMWTHYEL